MTVAALGVCRIAGEADSWIHGAAEMLIQSEPAVWLNVYTGLDSICADELERHSSRARQSPPAVIPFLSTGRPSEVLLGTGMHVLYTT